MSEYEKLEGLSRNSVIAYSVGQNNFETGFASRTNFELNDSITHASMPHAMVASFNAGAGPERYSQDWRAPNPRSNRITSEHAGEMLGHSLESSDGAVRLVSGLVAQDGLIRPVVFALEGQMPKDDERNERVLGVYSPKGAAYDHLDPAITAAKKLRSLSEGIPTQVDLKDAFREETIPDHLKASYDNLESKFVETGNSLVSTVVSSGVPLGPVIRKLGKVPGQEHLLSDANLVLTGSVASQESSLTMLENHGGLDGMKRVVSEYQKEGGPAVKARLALYNKLENSDGWFSHGVLRLQEDMRKDVFTTRSPEGPLLPPRSPVQMIKSSKGALAMAANRLREYKDEDLKEQHDRTQGRGGWLKKAMSR